MTAKEIKRRQQTPWQPRQRPHFSQGTDSTQKKPGFGQARGRGRGRGRAVARNQAWVSGGVLKASDFLGLRDNLMQQDRSQFSTDGDYSQLAESARNFAAASGNTHGYEMYDEYQGYAYNTSAAQDPGQSYTQQGQSYAQKGQKRGGANSSNSGFTAYGSYATSTATSQAQTAGKAVGRGRGYGATRGGGGGAAVGRGAGKPSVSAVGATTGYRQGFSGSNDMGYGLAVGATTATPMMQSTSDQVATEQYATSAVAADSYTAQQQQQLYEAYPSYEFADANAAAYSQAAYYTTTGGHYLTPDAGAAQFYSQF